MKKKSREKIANDCMLYIHIYIIYIYLQYTINSYMLLVCLILNLLVIHTYCNTVCIMKQVYREAIKAQRANGVGSSDGRTLG